MKPKTGIQSPEEILRNYRKKMRDDLQLVIFEISPDFFTVKMAASENAVFIGKDEAGENAHFVYARFKIKKLQENEGISQNISVDKIDFAEEHGLATISLQADLNYEADDSANYDLFVFCGWQSKQEAFENAVRKFENLGARRLVGNELENELNNAGLVWILGYYMSSDERQKIIGQV